MGQVFASFFRALISIFTFAESVGNTANNLAGWGEEASAVFKDEAKSNREIVLIKNEHNRKALIAQLAAEGVDTTKVVTESMKAITA